MSVYQLKYMDSVPDSAVCNEAVKLAQKKGFRQLKGFVNGVLRNIARNLSTIKLPPEKEPVRYLSVRYSMPEWIVRQWINDYGMEQTVSVLQAFLQEPPVTIRTNLLKITPEALERSCGSPERRSCPIRGWLAALRSAAPVIWKA